MSLSKTFRRAFARIPLFRKTRRRTISETPRYPPVMEGLPAVTVDELIATQEVMIRRLREASALDEQTFKECLLPCIRNYAAFVHLLPASQDHHHRGAGGLLRHGIEVAYLAANIAYATSFVEPNVLPKLKKPLELRWRASCLIAGLCHDLGKPVSDMDVVDESGELVWNPFGTDTPYLADFLRHHRVETYFLKWRRGRYRHHEDTSAIIFPYIVPRKTLQWLGEHDPETCFQLMQAVSRGASAPNSNRFREIVIAADRSSLLEDMKSSFSSTPTGSVGFAAQRHIVDAMRHLFGTGVWKTNAIGGRVFVTNQGTFIAWPGNAGGADIVRYIRENQIPGVTYDLDAIANDLIDIDVVEPFVVGDTSLRYWRVGLSLPNEQGVIANITMVCVKLKDPSYLIETYVPPIPAIVHGLENAGDHPPPDLSDGSEEPSRAQRTGDDDYGSAPVVGAEPRAAHRQRARKTNANGPITGADRSRVAVGAEKSGATPAIDDDHRAAYARTQPDSARANRQAAPVAAPKVPPDNSPLKAVDQRTGSPSQSNQRPARRLRAADGAPATSSAREPAVIPSSGNPSQEQISGNETNQNGIVSLLRSAFPSSVSAPSSKDRSYFSSRGKVAGSLLEIAKALREQARPPAWFTVARDTVQLAYPEAFEAVGVEPAPKVADLAATGLFASDPMRPGSILHKDKKGCAWLCLDRESGRNFASVTLYGGVVSAQPRSARPPAGSPLASSFANDLDSSGGTSGKRAAPKAAPSSPQTGVASHSGGDRREGASQRAAALSPINAPQRSSSASVQYLAQLRDLYTSNQFSDDEVYLDGGYVYIHPDAVRRFANAQRITEDLMRSILRLADCLEAPFGDTAAKGVRFRL